MNHTLAKFICAILGHKIPKDTKERPIIEYITGNLNGYHYSWSQHPCERCIAYEQVKRYTQEEWREVTMQAMESFIQEVEKAAKTLEDTYGNVNAHHTTNKMVH